MRKYIELLENSLDDGEAALEKENAITRIVTQAAKKIGLDLYDRNPIYYDDIDDMVNVRLYGEVSLAQLEGLKLLGSEMMVVSTSVTDVLEIRFKPIPDIQHVSIG